MKSWSNSDTVYPGPLVPEKRLLAAVLQRAVTDFLGTDAELRESARFWLLDDEPTDAPLSFKFICEALDLDTPMLRRAIIKQYEASPNGAIALGINLTTLVLEDEPVYRAPYAEPQHAVMQ